MADTPNGITFVVPAQMLAAGPGASARRGAADAAAAARVVAVPGEDVVRLTIANGPTLVLAPESARALMRSQAGTRDAAPADGAVPVRQQLAWPGLEAAASRGAARGWLGQVSLDAFEVVKGLLKEPAARLAADAIVRLVDDGVDEGVYALAEGALPERLKGNVPKLPAVPAAAGGGPLLVLVHGTFVDTVSTFGKLWVLHPDKVRGLFQAYGGRVHAFDHPTMGASPIANALALARALPAGARLHLLTHSRGGLVAEILARVCAAELDADELALFADPKYARHRADLQALAAEARRKGLRVERLVRVACPARGTTLASGRLDAYLSVLQWGLKLAQVPVVPQLVSFLHEIARRRTDPREIPGIEAMMPESAVVRWLDLGRLSIPGSLRVVAGDLQGDAVGSWVKTLLSDAFFWGDNDLVVQTRSMYGGVPRAEAGGEASFVLDRGGKVTHFDYFSNDSSVDAVMQALTADTPAGFQAIGPLSWQGESAGGLRAAARAAADPARPAVFVLPGILGSNLARDGRRIWLAFRFLDGLGQLAWDPADPGRIQPDGPVAGTYEALIERLAETHEVTPFAFDWRRPIEDEAKRLAAAVDAALAARKATGQPVRVVAHSMGGLVVRAMQLVAPRVWGDMMAHADARVLMLGVPNAGSWAPMQILSGDDTFGNALVAFGSLLHDGAARRLVAGMPGLMSLQAGLLDPATGLARREKWQALVDADLAALRARSLWHDEGARAAIYDWSAPPQDVLDVAARLRARLDAQVPALRGERKIVLVVGRADFTPTGFALGEAGLEYVGGADAGDGRVTHESAMQLGVRTWRADAEHGGLPALRTAFGAYVELLTRGDTALLDPFAAPAARGAAAPSLRSRPSRGLLPPVPPSGANDVFGGGRRAAAPPAAPHALEVRVLNADLRYVEHPLLVGHYSASRLTGAEQVVDDLVQNGMSCSLGAGLYPDAVGTHQVFGNAQKDPTRLGHVARPAAAVVCGLGPEGKLTASDLAFTVRRAILAYAQRLADRVDGKAAEFELASTLIGSGGVGVDPGSAAMAIAQGAIEARATLAATPWPKLRRLHLVEVYLDRAGDAWRALKVQEGATPDRLVVPERIQFGDGALRRLPESGYRGASYDFISALLVADGDAASPRIAYTLNTRRARTEIRATRAQGNLLRSMVEDASNAVAGDPEIGRTLFNLLIPIEMEPFLADRSGVVLELEASTAGIPWELLQTNRGREMEEDKPWAIRCGLVRKLRMDSFREVVRDTTADAHLLVIGEPNCDRSLYPRLDGARREAEAVAARIAAANATLQDTHKVTRVIEADAHAILNALFARPYRVVHIAGHGAPGPGGGVVLSGLETYLGVNEVEKMRVVPELVFLNCCHLAGREAISVLKDPPRAYDRPGFAANIAEALIGIGVRCVVAAGWAVDDDAAEVFATRFYDALFTGRRFIDAVREAREAAWSADRQGNTWAAYQCYGDPEWLWSSREAAAGQAGGALKEFVDNIASPVSLTLALEKIIADGQYSAAGREALVDRLRALEDAFGASWGRCGAVAEAFGVAHGSVKAMDGAIAWLRRAVDAEDGSASMQAVEKLGNFLARRGEARAEEAAALAREALGRTRMAEARQDVDEGIALLERLCAVQATTERENLLGSAFKRRTLVLARAGGRAEARSALDALAQAGRHYAVAEERARRADDPRVFYPAYSRLAVEVRHALVGGRAPVLDTGRVAGVREALRRASAIEPDFWNVAGDTELEMLVALAQGRLAESAEAILGTFTELQARVPSPLNWDSVRNNARFVLEPYRERASTAAAERAAAERLLAALDDWAGVSARPA